MKKQFKKISLVIVTLAIALLLGMNFVPLSVNASSDQKHVFDEQDLLTDEEEEKIEKMAVKYGKKKNVEFLIFTVANDYTYNIEDFSMDMHTAFAQNFDTDNFIIYTIDMNQRETLVDVHGPISDRILNDRCETIALKSQSNLKDGKYYSAIKKIIKNSYNTLRVKPGVNPDNLLFKTWFQLLIAFAIGGVSVVIMAYNSGGKVTTSSSTYLDSSNSRILNSHDHYLRTTTTRVKRESSNSGGSGGSSGGGGGGRSSGGCSF